MKEIKLLGRRILIKHVPKSQLRDLDPVDGEDDIGHYDPNEKTIYLWSGLGPEAEKRVLLHEATHAVLDICGLDGVLGATHEEAVCVAMENLLELFQDKKFVEAMSE